MLSSEKLRKLEELAGKLAKGKLLRASQLPAGPIEPSPPPAVVRLEEAIPGQVAERTVGKYYHVRKDLTRVWSEAAPIVRFYQKTFTNPTRTPAPESALAALLRADPDAITYLDIETCGFAGNVIFLVGWCWFDGQNELVVEQALARDYAEEPAILSAAAERLAQTQVLVTFNGKSFDLPSLRDRFVIHRLCVPPVPVHLDVLHQARAQWKKSLPNCQLKTLETYLCGRTRHGDIPGQDIPQVYHDFVKNTDARKLKLILHHNFLDLVTLAEVTARLLAGHTPDF